MTTEQPKDKAEAQEQTQHLPVHVSKFYLTSSIIND